MDTLPLIAVIANILVGLVTLGAVLIKVGGLVTKVDQHEATLADLKPRVTTLETIVEMQPWQHTAR